MRLVVDTHAWIWWVTEDRRLSGRALRAIEKSRSGDGLLLSLISLWEVAKKVEKSQLVLDRPLDAWLDQATARPGLQLADLTRPVLIESCRLPGQFHGDPADQLIVATARLEDVVVVTRDDRISDYEHVRTIW